ncbi:MAG: DUF4830 domain-containing protein [Clostridia bacterium]|nr:DUF4830 domain-containing protein [Clostridia bacterium]
MFVYSVKTSKAKMAALLVALAAAVIALIMVIGRGEKPAATDDSAVNYKAESAAERTAFLSQFGWKISEDPVEVSEVIIPENFDDGYTEYAAMNKAQGLDLEPFKGVRAKRWTYTVLNYPGLENSKSVQANLLIYDGRVIGGDVCSLEQGGFISGFDFPQNAAPATTAPPQSAVVETTTEQ